VPEESEFALKLFAQSSCGEEIAIETIRVLRRVHHQIRILENEHLLFPIGIAASGRMGATLAMRMFNAHPQITVHNEYPFERSLLNFGIETFHKLTLRAAFDHVGDPSPAEITKIAMLHRHSLEK
jgi:hypothetical protein